ncbi:uncharacterized protein Tco025E_01463 [Trypanosoma conorhini]|uniref:Uncharacterized protein n=1 Tax=Trypanosoma conorhini TaxID=83891 RepID=A0A422Q8J2_9TRYP|nr:uncharacterized protein Tco025E_01463 [Trypanosoma conorhini]RNF26247.1 hypothetical protein Tco025E_01463 [Trypanosoma conorhini]
MRCRSLKELAPSFWDCSSVAVDDGRVEGWRERVDNGVSGVRGSTTSSFEDAKNTALFCRDDRDEGTSGSRNPIPTCGSPPGVEEPAAQPWGSCGTATPAVSDEAAVPPCCACNWLKECDECRRGIGASPSLLSLLPRKETLPADICSEARGK